MLIFFDIDGTLIGKDYRTMPESARKAIQQARTDGHVCMINTGRSLALVGPEVTGQTEFDGLLLGCGTMIILGGEVLLHRTFTEEEGEQILEGLYRNGIDAVLEGSTDNFRDRDDRIFTDVFRKYIHKFDDLHYRSFQEAPGHFDKFYAYVDKTSKMDAFRQEFESRLDFVDRKEGFFEIMPKGCSKAKAMEFIADRLGIPMEQTVAIGDSSNDISMLGCAGIGIAMGNATEDVKKIADHVTTDVDQDGIRNALMWLEQRARK